LPRAGLPQRPGSSLRGAVDGVVVMAGQVRWQAGGFARMPKQHLSEWGSCLDRWLDDYFHLHTVRQLSRRVKHDDAIDDGSLQGHRFPPAICWGPGFHYLTSFPKGWLCGSAPGWAFSPKGW